MLLGEGVDLRALHHRAVIVGEFADHAHRRQVRELAQVDGRFRVARAHEHAAILGNEREDVAGADEIGRAHVVVGERAHGVRALLGGDAGGQPMLHVDRDGEGGAQRRVVRGDHRIEAQAAGFRDSERRADDAAGVADDEGHLFRRAERGGDDQVALVLAVVVVRDDDDFTAGESLDGFGDGMGHQGLLSGCGQKIVRGDGSAGLTGDQFRRVPGQPGLGRVAQLGHGAGRDADPPREFHTRHAIAG